MLISSKASRTKIQAARKQANNIEVVILIDDDLPQEALSYRQLAGAAAEETFIADTAPDDMAALIYTAGTTGKPKGVIHTHGSLYSNALMQHQTFPSTDGMTYVSILPLCHSYGIASSNVGLFRTSTMVLLNSFDLNVIFSSIEKYRASILAAVPTMYVYMLMYPEPEKFDLSSMKYWICGSAPLAVETWNKFKEIYGFEIIEGGD